MAPILGFIFGCSVCSGLSFCCCAASVFCCLLVLPSAISSARVRVGGGSGGRLDVVGEVAIGDVGPASPGRSRCCFLGDPSCCGARLCSFVVLVPASCVFVRDVSVPVSLVGRATLVAIGAVGGGTCHGPALTTSINCWLYLCGAIFFLTVLARMTLLLIPRMCSPVLSSRPNQMPSKKRCSSFGYCLSVGTMYCTVSPNSQSGVCGFFCHLLK